MTNEQNEIKNLKINISEKRYSIFIFIISTIVSIAIFIYAMFSMSDSVKEEFSYSWYLALIPTALVLFISFIFGFFIIGVIPGFIRNKEFICDAFVLGLHLCFIPPLMAIVWAVGIIAIPALTGGTFVFADFVTYLVSKKKLRKLLKRYNA